MSCRNYDCVGWAVDHGGCPNRDCEWHGFTWDDLTGDIRLAFAAQMGLLARLARKFGVTLD